MGIDSKTVINWKHVARDVAILWALTSIGGFIVGTALAAAGGANPSAGLGLGILASNTVFMVIGFCVSGCLVRTDRFKHLTWVAFLFWLTSLVNVPLGYTTIPSWMFGLIPGFVLMLIGGGISQWIVKDPVVQSDEGVSHH